MHQYLIELNKIAESHGGKLLSTEYFGAIHKYWFLDEEGNKFEAWGYGIKSGKRWSPYTANKRKAKKLIQYTIDDLKKHAISKGGECLSTEYINTKTKYLWVDNKGREFHMAWCNVLADQWSPHEKKETLSKLNRYSIDFYKDFAKKLGGEFLSDKLNEDSKNDTYLWKDSEGNIFNRTYSNILRTGILKYKTVSKYEDIIFNFLKENNIEFIKNDRQTIPPFELDFYIPSLKLAIEINGAFFHSLEKGKEKYYHSNKQNRCQKLDIELIQIMDIELRDKELQIKSFLKSKLHLNRTIGARECQLKYVDKKDASDFLNKYHILGSTKFINSIGLFYNDELISLITLGNHHRDSKCTSKILSRYVTKDGYNVCGGLSKLVKRAKTDFGDLITWIDLRWSNGSNWIRSGWKLDGTLRPDYNLYDAGRKIIVKKHKLVSLMTDYTKNENTLIKERKLLKIYDCGKLRLKI